MDVSVKRPRSHTNGGCEDEVTATLYKLQSTRTSRKIICLARFCDTTSRQQTGRALTHGAVEGGCSLLRASTPCSRHSVVICRIQPNQAKHGDVRPELGSDSSFDHRKRCLCQTWCAVEERGRTGIGERTVSNIVPAQKYKTDFIDVVA